MQTPATIAAVRRTTPVIPLAATAISLALAACMGTGDSASSEPNEEAIAARAEALAPSADGVGSQSADGVSSQSADGVSSLPPTASTSDTPAARVCRSLLQRGRDCSAVFLPALVAERVRLDIPAGIAAEDRSIGRALLLSQALDEYTDDSTDERIASTCAGLAQQLPAPRAEQLVTNGEACLVHDACEPFAACAVPISIQP